jgi:hypothetical protein
MFVPSELTIKNYCLAIISKSIRFDCSIHIATKVRDFNIGTDE